MSTTVSYKGNTIATLNNKTKTLTTGGTWVEADIQITDTSSSGTPAISVVDTTDSAGGTVRTITALDISDTTAVASDVASGKYFYTADGTKTQGSNTGGGGTPSQTQHSIYFEFSDNTNTTITAYWNDTFISNAITATTPSTYGQKTVTLAQLDGTAWYEPANIPLNTELIDFTAVVMDSILNGEDGTVMSGYPGSFVSDFTIIDPSMTFAFVGYRWYDMAFYDVNKTYISGVTQETYVDSYENDYVHGTLTSARIPSNAMYIRLCSYPTYDMNSYMSLIRTA